MMSPDAFDRDWRALILAPTGRDASLITTYLEEAGITAESCAGIEELCQKLIDGAGAALIAEEAFDAHAIQCLTDALAAQPTWSDLPVIVLTTGGDAATKSSLNNLNILNEAGNLTLIERPARIITLISAVRSALRARQRQYQVRDHLIAERESKEERNRLWEEARDANRAKDLFLATLSHELRTPLTAILGWGRLIRASDLDESTARRGMEVIERNSQALRQLVDDILDVSRIITGKLSLRMKQVSLAPVVDAAIDSVRQAADAKAIALSFEQGKDSDLVTGDAERLQQVVWNLLSNAIKFTPKGGRVGVRLKRQGSDVRIEVSDTGKGISPELLPHVFERFRQGNSSTTRQFGGLGLGLAIVRHLVEHHGGVVSAESEGEGKGSTFVVDLPMAAVNSSDQEIAGIPEFSPVAIADEGLRVLKGLNVLVVEDQPDSRELITLVLQNAGAEVVAVESAAAALSILMEAHFDVLVSDIGMPEEDGYSLVRKVRALPQRSLAMVPAVALTAYASESDRGMAISAGFNNHVVKPVDPSDLIAAVAGAARISETV